MTKQTLMLVAIIISSVSRIPTAQPHSLFGSENALRRSIVDTRWIANKH